MGRFYQTSQAQMIDFSLKLPEELMIKAVQFNDMAVNRMLMSLEQFHSSLQGNAYGSTDTKYLNQIFSHYKNKIDEKTTELVNNPLFWRDRTQGIRDLGRSIYNEKTKGDWARIENNYLAAKEWEKKLDELSQKEPDKYLPQDIENLKMAALIEWENKGGTFGFSDTQNKTPFSYDTGKSKDKWHSFSYENPAEYYNINEEVLKYLKEIKPEKGAEYRIDGNGKLIYKVGEKWEAVSDERIMEAINFIAGSDPKFRNYYSQILKVNSILGQPLTLSTVKIEDGNMRGTYNADGKTKEGNIFYDEKTHSYYAVEGSGKNAKVYQATPIYENWAFLDDDYINEETKRDLENKGFKVGKRKDFLEKNLINSGIGMSNIFSYKNIEGDLSNIIVDPDYEHKKRMELERYKTELQKELEAYKYDLEHNNFEPVTTGDRQVNLIDPDKWNAEDVWAEIETLQNDKSHTVVKDFEGKYKINNGNITYKDNSGKIVTVSLNDWLKDQQNALLYDNYLKSKQISNSMNDRIHNLKVALRNANDYALNSVIPSDDRNDYYRYLNDSNYRNDINKKSSLYVSYIDYLLKYQTPQIPASKDLDIRIFKEFYGNVNLSDDEALRIMNEYKTAYNTKRKYDGYYKKFNDKRNEWFKQNSGNNVTELQGISITNINNENNKKDKQNFINIIMQDPTNSYVVSNTTVLGTKSENYSKNAVPINKNFSEMIGILRSEYGDNYLNHITFINIQNIGNGGMHTITFTLSADAMNKLGIKSKKEDGFFMVTTNNQSGEFIRNMYKQKGYAISQDVIPRYNTLGNTQISQNYSNFVTEYTNVYKNVTATNYDVKSIKTDNNGYIMATNGKNLQYAHLYSGSKGNLYQFVFKDNNDYIVYYADGNDIKRDSNGNIISFKPLSGTPPTKYTNDTFINSCAIAYDYVNGTSIVDELNQQTLRMSPTETTYIPTGYTNSTTTYTRQ